MLIPPPRSTVAEHRSRGPNSAGPTRRSALHACAGLVTVALAVATPRAVASQELPLKREIPGAEAFSCPDVDATVIPAAEAREQADRLGSTAAQAVILGERERARDLLSRAVELDPSDAELAYQYARILEDLGDGDTAVTHYCRMVALDPESEDAPDAQARIRRLTEEARPELPAEAVAAFRSGISGYDAARFEAAAEAFGRAADSAPEWTDAVYDRGVALLRLGRRQEALRAFSRYLELEPEAPDAISVSQRMGQLQNVGAVPSPGTALGLGLVFPGLGQFYSGRELAGMGVLAVAGGAVVAAFLIKDIEVRCYDPEPDGSCAPENQDPDERVTRPYLAAGLGAAAAVGLIGAIEAFVNARRRRSGEGLASLEWGRTRITVPVVSSGPAGVEISLARLTF